MPSKIHLIETETLGECWMQVSKKIMEQGHQARYDDALILEIARLTTVVEVPDSEDAFIKERGDPEWLAWMHENFFVQKEVEELGDAPSYAVRLFNYAYQGRDQIQWVADRINDHREARSATITTFLPLTDTSYIACISLLDFWIPEGELELIVYAHGLDFGKKAYGNLVELALLQEMVAEKVGCPVGRLVIHVKTAHIYEPEWEYMRGLVQSADVF
jgi:thymidylate synthase